MDTKFTSPVTAPYILLARGFVVVLGAIAVWWGVAEFPNFRQDSSIEQVATQIIAGEPFKSETLAELHPSLDSIKASAYCRPAALRSTAIIELRMQEVAASKSDREQIDQQLKSTESVIRKSLSCAPADSFLWLALYSVEVTKTGFKPDYLKYLRLSYQLGPQEGWIALKRDPLAFAQFQNLPVDLRGDAVSEFVAMVADHFIDQAAQILIGPAWPERELILSRVAQLSDSDRQHLVDALFRRGYEIVPGIGLAPRDPHRFAPQIRVPK